MRTPTPAVAAGVPTTCGRSRTSRLCSTEATAEGLHARSHERSMLNVTALRTKRSLGLLIAVTLVGCSAPDQLPEPTPSNEASTAPATVDTAGRACANHFPDVRLSELSTVYTVRHVGPLPASPPPGPLDAYPDDEPVALCLVPNGSMFDAIAVVVRRRVRHPMDAEHA